MTHMVQYTQTKWDCWMVPCVGVVDVSTQGAFDKQDDAHGTIHAYQAGLLDGSCVGVVDRSTHGAFDTQGLAYDAYGTINAY